MQNLQKRIQLLMNLYKSKKLSDAESFGKELIMKYQKVDFLYNLLGLILMDQKKIDEAIEFYEKGLKIKKDNATIYNNLGTAYKHKQNYDIAENYYKRSIRIDNKIPEAQNNLGNLYSFLNKHKDAISCYKNAININPNFFISHYNLGVAYKATGKFSEAKKHLVESVKLNPHFHPGHRTLSQIAKYKKEDLHFAELKKIYNDSKIRDIEKTEIAFALGKASDDIHDFDGAYKYYAKGNELRRKNISFSISNEKREFENIKKIFKYDIYKDKITSKLDNTAIFVLGMPRSGTTLIEQILSSHPKVFGGDELFYLPQLVNKHLYDDKKKSFLHNLNEIDFKKIGQQYLDKLKKISGNSERVTDKLPINFKWIGLIKIILPNSKIIHCTRSPKDNCLSIFKNYFSNPTLNFAYNLNEISDFYLLYSDLMKYWKKTLPNFIFDIKYEKIIENPKKQIQNLLKVCDLSWNENCLEFHNNRRPIKTASDVQARKKIYKTSVQSWKNYNKYLKKFFDKLPKE